MVNKKEQKYLRRNIGNIGVWLLGIIYKCAKCKCFADIIALILGFVFQFLGVFHSPMVFLIIHCLGEDRYKNLKSLSLILGMASAIGLSTIVVFGFNLRKTIQQFWQGIIKGRGLNCSSDKFLISEVKTNYFLFFISILLYICIVMDWCTFFYILLIYDIVCYIVLILKLWLIETFGDKYLKNNYERKGKEEKRKALSEILQNCVENNGQFNVSAVKTYIEWLLIYLEEENGEKENTFNIEKFYNNVQHIFECTMENLAIDQMTHSFLLLTLIKEFCKVESQNFSELKKQIILAVMITYSLDREKDIDINLIYKEITNWNDKSVELRYCIAVSRLEYLYTVNQVKNKILLTDNIFYLYRTDLVNASYEEIIYILWYLWSKRDGKLFCLYIEDLRYFVYAFHKNLRTNNIVEARNSFYTLVKGLKY